MRLLKHRESDAVLLAMREDLVGYIMAAGVVHRVDELFSLFDRPQVTCLTTGSDSHMQSSCRGWHCQQSSGLQRWPFNLSQAGEVSCVCLDTTATMQGHSLWCQCVMP